MLERKWPEKYNDVGHVRWTGRMYGSGLPYILGWRRARVHHGVWGAAPFQSLYEPAPTLLASLPQMPEWHLMTGTMMGIAALSVVWSPLRLAVPLFMATLLPSVAQAFLGGARARFPDAPRRWGARLAGGPLPGGPPPVSTPPPPPGGPPGGPPPPGRGLPPPPRPPRPRTP